jgi:hypothetical protein
MAVIIADCSSLKIAFCGHTGRRVNKHIQIQKNSFLEPSVRVDSGMVFIFFIQYADRFLAEKFVAGTTSDSKSYCSLVVSIHSGLMCCGVFSILLVYL